MYKIHSKKVPAFLLKVTTNSTFRMIVDILGFIPLFLLRFKIPLYKQLDEGRNGKK